MSMLSGNTLHTSESDSDPVSVVGGDCHCDADEHPWSAPSVEEVDAVAVLRQHCVCPCGCNGLHVMVSAPTKGAAQHRF
ncbi:hypothetical protein [Haloactinomyces albus]|uniref:Uncharacterized protein n=1 Tax=Haloactinomyces albus TaxID=1352928 RepID=A0AAE3ZBE7_9ACTN|nr:hypothetical protein [Haloactinomyces albus]MDR7300029.1 hypothetical protein [Haloactinomyces albus]